MIDKDISDITQNVSHKPKYEEIKLFNSKKIKLYREFILINQKMFNDYISTIFKFKCQKKNISFISVNNKHILKFNNKNQYRIFIGTFNPKNCSYNIEQILDFDNTQYLNDEFNALISMDIDNYYNKRLMINKNDNISPIFSGEKIIGYSYYYNNSIKDYSFLNKYIKYLSNENLTKLLSLYILYKRIEEKLNNYNYRNSEECYLIDNNLLINIKNEISYKLLKDELDNNQNFNNSFLDKDFNLFFYKYFIIIIITNLEYYS